MTDRFSNFDDDDDVSGFGTSSIASSSLESNGTHGKKINGERKPNVKASESSFDDFDSEWDSEAPSAPGPSNRPGRSPSIPSNVSSSVSKPHNSGARSPLGGGGDFGDFESPKALDRDRIRSSNLDDGSDSHFGSSRTGSRGETDKKVSTGLQLRDFSLTPSNEDSHRSRPNGPLRDDDSERKGSKYDEQMPPMPQVQYEPFSVEPPSHYQNYLYLLKYIHGLKILCGIHMLYVILAIIFRIWYLIGGIIVAPFGFFAVHHLNRKMILVWAALFAADTLAEGIGALVMSSKTTEEGGGLLPTLVHMTIVLLRFGLTYLIYRFWTKLPENAAEYFALFTSSPEPDTPSPV